MNSFNFTTIFHKKLAFIRTLFSYALGAITGIFCFLPCLILVAVLPDRYRYDNRVLFKLLDWTFKGIIRATLVPVHVKGVEHLPHEPVVFVANHQSAMDIPLVGMLMNGYPHIWYVMEYYAHVPILGFFVRRMGIVVDRKSPASAARAIIRGMHMTEHKKRHSIIFPEGGRYTDGKIHEFFYGFAVIAKKTRRPVIPIFIYNVGKVYPPGSFLINWYPIMVTVGTPIAYMPGETDMLFGERVRDWFVEQQAQHG